MSEPSDPIPSNTVVDRIKVREVAGVLRTREALDAAVGALLHAGFDRSDIDLMASIDAVRQKLRNVYIAAEELPDVPQVPRRAFIPREEMSAVTIGVAALLVYIGATAASFGIVASGGSLALAAAAAMAGGAAGGGLGALIARLIGREQAKELEAQMEAGGLVLWVRVRSPDRERKAQQILLLHGAEAVRVHEIEIEKHLEDLPLSSLRPDPWLGDEPLAHP